MKTKKPVRASDNDEVRLSIKAWAREFGCVTQPGLSKALHRSGQLPDSRGRYSTGQVREALWGRAYQERIGLMRAKIETIKLQTAERMAGLIPANQIKAHNQLISDAIRDEINSWKELDAKQKSNLLHHLPL